MDILTTEGTPRTAAMKAVGLASSSYYYRPVSKRKPRALGTGLVAAINKVRQGHGEVYGYREVTEVVRAMDINVNGKKVLLHLRSLGLTQPRKVKSLALTRPAVVELGAANTYWEADFTSMSGRVTAMPTCAPSSMPGTEISWVTFSPTAAGP